MKISFGILALLGLSAVSCSTLPENRPVPQMVTYHVKHGAEQDLEPLIKRTWQTYVDLGVVLPEPHILMRVYENPNENRYIEIFVWRGWHAMEHPPEAVTTQWQKIVSLCEPRQGERAMDWNPMTIMLVPAGFEEPPK